MHQEQTSTVYVADLPVKKDTNGIPVSDINEDFLRQLFQGQGIVQSPDSVIIKTKIRPNGNPYSYAFIKFENHEKAVNAIAEFNYTKLDKVPIRLILADNETKRIIRNNQGNLFIKNLDPEIEVSQLHDAFANFGEIISCVIPSDIKYVPQIDDPTQTEIQYVSRGYGYIQFKNPEDAKQALIDLKDASINGQKIEIQPFCRRQHINPETNFNNCYIKNFPQTYKDDDIKKLFEEFGTPISYKVITDENGNSKQFGFCCMKTHDEAVKAVEGLNGREIENYIIMCGRAMPKSERSKELQIKTENWRKINYEKYKNRNLYVRNFDEEVTDEELMKIFTKFGDVESATVMREEDGRSKKFGFVCFKTEEDAKKCLKESSLILINEKQLYVALAQQRDLRLKANILKSQLKNTNNWQFNKAQDMMGICLNHQTSMQYYPNQMPIEFSQMFIHENGMTANESPLIGTFNQNQFGGFHFTTKEMLRNEIIEKNPNYTTLLHRLRDMSEEQAKELASNQQLFNMWMEQN